MQEKKLIAFDLFDTCFDLPQANISYRKLFSALGILERRRELKKILLTSRKSMEEILSEFLPHQDIQSHLATYNENIRNEVDSVCLYPETLSVLSDLKNKWYELAAVSNLAVPYIQSLDRLLPHTFHYEILSSEVGVCKPDVKIFDCLKNISWYHSDEILMVGDDLTSDVQWAKNEGIDPVRIDRKSLWITYHKDHISISSLEQLLEIL